MAGDRYSTGMLESGDDRSSRRKSLADRAEYPTSRRVMLEMRTSPRSMRLTHFAASVHWWSLTSADLSTSHSVNSRPVASSRHRPSRRRFARSGQDPPS